MTSLSSQVLSQSVWANIESFFWSLLRVAIAIAFVVTLVAAAPPLYRIWYARKRNSVLLGAEAFLGELPFSEVAESRRNILIAIYERAHGGAGQGISISSVQEHLQVKIDPRLLCHSLAYLDHEKLAEWHKGGYGRQRHCWDGGKVALTGKGVQAVKEGNRLEPESLAAKRLLVWLYQAAVPNGTGIVKFSAACSDFRRGGHAAYGFDRHVLLGAARQLVASKLLTLDPDDWEASEFGWSVGIRRVPAVHPTQTYLDAYPMERKLKLTAEGVERAKERMEWGEIDTSSSPPAGRSDVPTLRTWGALPEWLDVLERIYRSARGDLHHGVAAAALLSGDRFEPGNFADDVRILIRSGLARAELPLEGFERTRIYLTSAGGALAEDVYARRRSGRDRSWACRDALLHWLYDRDGSRLVLDFLQDESARHLGEALSESDVRAAWHFLVRSRLAAEEGGDRSAPHGEISDEGVSVVEREEDPSRYVSQRDASAPRIEVRDSDNVNIAAQSPGATLSIHVSADARKSLRRVADAMETALPVLGLAEPDRAEAVELVATLREDASREIAPTSGLQKALNRVAEIAVAGSGAALGTGIVALAHEAARALGMG